MFRASRDTIGLVREQKHPPVAIADAFDCVVADKGSAAHGSTEGNSERTRWSRSTKTFRIALATSIC